MRVAWLVPRAHGTPTMKLWSFDVRNWGPIQATLEARNERARRSIGTCARGTRTIGMCSFDARNRGSTRPHYLQSTAICRKADGNFPTRFLATCYPLLVSSVPIRRVSI